MKPRINIYLSEQNFARLHAAAGRPGKTLSGIIDEALDDYFNGARQDERESAMLRRLDRMTRQFNRIEQKNVVNGEALALYIRYFLMVTPHLPSDQIDAARAKGDQHFDQFLEQLGRDLQSGKRLLQRAVDDVIAEQAEFFTEEDLERLHQPLPETSKREAGHA
ncbi:MAG: CopG family transcriptional regulator [Pseudomonadota bacterium]